MAIAADLYGIDTMWIIALSSYDNQVSLNCIHKLNSLFQYFSPESLKPKLSKIREDYIGSCMKYLNNLIEKYNNYSGKEKNEEINHLEKQIERCLILAKTFIEDFNKKVKKSSVSPIESTQFPEIITNGKQLTLFIKFEKNGSTCILQVRNIFFLINKLNSKRLCQMKLLDI